MAKKEKPTAKAKKPEEKFPLFWGIWTGVEAAILLIAGILAIVFGCLYDANDPRGGTVFLSNVLPYLVGSFVIMDAILRVVMVVARKKEQGEEPILLIAAFEITAGIVVMLMHDVFQQLLIYFVSILMITMGGVLLLVSIFAIAKKASRLFVPVLEILFAAVLIAAGIGVLVLYHQADNTKIVLLISGTLLCAAAIGLGVATIVTVVKEKKQYALVKVEEEPKPNNPKKPEAKPEPQGDVVIVEEEPKAIEEKK